MPEAAPRIDPSVKLSEFLQQEGLVLLPARPQVTCTEDGGVVVKPQFVVKYKES